MNLLEESLSDFIEYQQISQDVKNIVKEQCNLDAQEMLMITNIVQCKSCYKYATPGYTSCKCGFVHPGASDEIKKQVPKDVMNFFSMLTTSAFVLKAGTSREKTVGRSEVSQLYHHTRVSITKVLWKRNTKTFSSDIRKTGWYRHNRQSQDFIEKKVK